MNKKPVLVFTGIAVFYVFSFLYLHNGHWPHGQLGSVIKSDGIGLYSYLPKLFLEQNLTYSENDHVFASPNLEGVYLNRFYCGTAILESPFFVLSCVGAKLFGYPIDGYSLPFQLGVALAALFYAMAGLILLHKSITRFWQIPENTSLLVIAFLAIGTNLIFYTTYFGSFSHVYSFFSIAALLYTTQLVIVKGNYFTFFLVAFLLALIVVIRPVNVLIVLILPALFTDKSSFLAFFKKILSPRYFTLLLFGWSIPIVIQILIWYAQTGHFIEWSYQQEGFYFLQPAFWNSLFGIRRGLFIYCPLLLLVFPGVYFVLRKNKWQCFWFILFLLSFAWVTASWWHYTYGDTFGIRPYNDILPVLFILLAYTFHYFPWRKTLILIALIFTFFNLIFSYQFAIGILNISTMDTKKFSALFLKTSPRYINLYGGSDDIPPYAPNGFIPVHHFKQTYDDFDNGYFNASKKEWVGGTEFVFPVKYPLARHTWIEISYKRKISRSDAMKKVIFVFHTINPTTGETKIYYTFKVKQNPSEKTNSWQLVKHRVWMPNSLNGNDIVKAYIWNINQEEFSLDDYEINIQIPKW